MTPSARSLAAGRANGWLIDVVERWIGGGRIKVRKDLFGFLDLVALDGQPGVLGIQVTSGSNVSARVKKIGTECRDAAERWLRAGNRIEVHGWRKIGRPTRWAARTVQVTLESLEALDAGPRVDLGAGEAETEL